MVMRRIIGGMERGVKKEYKVWMVYKVEREKHA
jgi:hypothetical protein